MIALVRKPSGLAKTTSPTPTTNLQSQILFYYRMFKGKSKVALFILDNPIGYMSCSS